MNSAKLTGQVEWFTYDKLYIKLLPESSLDEEDVLLQWCRHSNNMHGNISDGASTSHEMIMEFYITLMDCCIFFLRKP